MSNYYEAMEEFAAACQDAYILCIKAFHAADNEDGAPASEIAKLQKRLFSIAEDANAIAEEIQKILDDAHSRGALVGGLYAD